MRRIEIKITSADQDVFGVGCFQDHQAAWLKRSIAFSQKCVDIKYMFQNLRRPYGIEFAIASWNAEIGAKQAKLSVRHFLACSLGRRWRLDSAFVRD